MSSNNRALRAMVIAILMTTTVFAVMVMVPMNASAGTVHTPIGISSDADFADAGNPASYGVTGGSGTAADPYIISGWDIDSSSSTGIDIEYTSAYFTIMNCVITGSSYYGIYLGSNAHANILNCTVNGNYYGIYSSDSNNQIANCTLSGNQYGIYSGADDSISVLRCNITGFSDYAVYLWWTPLARIIDNNISSGYSGIYLSDTTATVCTITGNRISSTTGNAIIGYHSSNVNIIGNNLTDPGNQGISLQQCADSVVYHNNIDTWGGEDYYAPSSNQWDNGYPSGGNYWVLPSHDDSFSGPDQTVPGFDGISDSPVYFWDSAADNYPLASWFVGNVEPIAGFNVSKRVLNTTTALLMNASFSADAEDHLSSLQFRWDYNGDLAWDTGYGSNPATSNTYAVEGNYTVRLEVMDSGGLTDIATIDVIISNNAHAPIGIFSDSDFTGANSTTGVTWGSGTEADPYIISGWVIDATDSIGIDIEYTTAFFVIQDCQVYFGGSRQNGIFLYSLVNGTVEGSVSMFNSYGLSIYYSADVEVNDCTVSYNHDRGIYTYQSTDMVIDGNNASFNPEDNLYIYRTQDTLISNNVARNCSGNGIYMDECTNITVLRNNLSNAGNYGIIAYWTEFLNIVRNEFVDDLGRGVYLYNTNEVNIIGNNFTGVVEGYGLGIQSSMNALVHHNNFINLGQYAADTGSSTFDAGYPLGGNYWDIWMSPDANHGPAQDVPGADGIVDTPYVIDAGSQDNYPLTAPYDMSDLPPIAVISTSARIINVSTALDVDASDSWDVEDPASSLTVRWDWESDGTWDTSWSTTKTASHSYASEGTYTVTLEVNDTAGQVTSATAMVVVSDAYRATNIHINGDGQFDVAHGVNGGGDGSAGNPYVIQDYVLDATVSPGIWIENTNAYFIIQRVAVYYGLSTGNDAIYLNHVQNGTIQISDFYMNQYGIYTQNSGNISIADCAFDTTYASIYGWRTDDVDVSFVSSENTLQAGIQFETGCDNIAIIDSYVSNTSSYGILISGSCTDIIIVDNKMENVESGIYFSYVDQALIMGNNMSSMAYGMQVYYSSNLTVSMNEFFGPSYGLYLYDLENALVDYNYFNATDSYGIYIYSTSRMIMIDNCQFNGNGNGIRIRTGAEYIMVSNCTAKNVNYGVYAYQDTNISIRQNNFSGASSFGVEMIEVGYFEVVGNNLSQSNDGAFISSCSNFRVVENVMYDNNGNGLVAQSSSDGMIENNILADATGYGIYLSGCNGLMITGNNLLSNANQAYDDNGPANRWNETAAYGGGNYWSNYTFPDADLDGFGDTPALINVNGVDYLPLASPWVPNQAPTADFTVTPAYGTLSTSFAFDASGCSDVEDPTAYLEVRWDWTNDGTYDTGWSTTKTATHTYASPGTKTIRLEVRDNGSITDTVTKTVVVNETAPVTTVTLNGTTGANSWFTSNVVVNLTAVDDYSGVDAIRYAIGTGAWTNFTANFTLSTEGVFVLNVSAIDMVGLEEANQTVTVKIDKSLPTLTFNQSSGLTVTKNFNVVSWNGSDAISGIDHFEVKIGTGSFVSVGKAMSYNFTGLTNGTYNITVKAVDNAGHEYNTSIQFTVSLPGTGGGISGDLLIYVLIIVVIVIVVVVLVMVMKRGKKPAALDQMTPEPPAPPTD